MCTSTQSVIDIRENSFSVNSSSISDEEAFEMIMSCFYGATVTMERSQLGIFYQIIKFL